MNRSDINGYTGIEPQRPANHGKDLRTPDGYGIIGIDTSCSRLWKECKNDRDERTTLYPRSSGGRLASIGRYNHASHQGKETWCCQGWEAVEDIRDSHGRLPERTRKQTRRQKIRAGLSQLTFERVAVLLAPMDWNPFRNKHGTRYQQYAYTQYRQVSQNLSRGYTTSSMHRRAG